MIRTSQLGQIAVGLNIEGCRPAKYMPSECKWYNIIQVIDEPLMGETFDAVMKKVKDHNLQFIEEAVGINVDNLVETYVRILEKIKKKHKNILVHVHQYKGTTKLHIELQKRTGLKVILDLTNFHENPVDYREKYPNIDALVSLSQCAGFGHMAGEFIVPKGFLNFDVNTNTIDLKPEFQTNYIEDVLPEELSFVKGNILVVNDLWNPDVNELEPQLINIVKNE